MYKKENFLLRRVDPEIIRKEPGYQILLIVANELFTFIQ